MNYLLFVEEATVSQRRKECAKVLQAVFGRTGEKNLVFKSQRSIAFGFSQDFLSQWEKWKDQILWEFWNSHKNELMDYIPQLAFKLNCKTTPTEKY